MNEEFFEDQNEQQIDQSQQVEEAKEEAKEVLRSKEYNLRIMRERMELIERENQEYKRILQQQQQPVEKDDLDDDVEDDSFIEAKQYKKNIRNIQKDLKETKKLLEENTRNNELNSAQVSLKAQFNDFDDVVTEENLKKLSDSQPVLYRTLLAAGNIYDRGYSAYAMIKNGNISKKDSQYSNQDKRLEENKAKPRAIGNASPQAGDTPLSKVGDYDRRILTEERKDQLRKQVEEAKRYR